MGLMLRGAYVWGIGSLDYRNLMHGHSHVAMLGWVYLALFALIWYRFIPPITRKKNIYEILFYSTQVTVVGMMISFPLQGYGPWSIAFSTLNIMASYVFCYRVWKDCHIPNEGVKLMFKTSLVLLIISTLGVWSLGPLAVFGDRNSALYQIAIQFYLHFQFHGWFTFAVLALVVNFLPELNKKFKGPMFRWFYGLLISSTLLTYALVLAWAYGGVLNLWVNGLGLILQLTALALFLKMWIKTVQPIPPFTMSGFFFKFGLLSWVLKVLIQSVVILPEVAVISLSIRSLMIGFIHLTMLGFISGVLFAIFHGPGGWLGDSRFLIGGGGIFTLGFVVTELFLFVQGLFYWIQWGQIPFYYNIMFIISIFLPLGILLIIIKLIKNMIINKKHDMIYS